MKCEICKLRSIRRRNPGKLNAFGPGRHNTGCGIITLAVARCGKTSEVGSQARLATPIVYGWSAQSEEAFHLLSSPS